MAGAKQDDKWAFPHLRVLMREAPFSVKDMVALSRLSSATIGRVGRGECVKRETAMSLFDAICTSTRFKDVLRAKKGILLIPCGSETDFDIEEFLKEVG